MAAAAVASGRSGDSGLGAATFRKEFYDSALCVEEGGTGEERSLKGFLRERVRIEGGGSAGKNGGRVFLILNTAATAKAKTTTTTKEEETLIPKV